MPTRVLLEGPAIEPLLAQVRQEYGPSARIISADKVRTGGLGGFFAKQRYELSVEVDDAGAGAGAGPAAGAPARGPAGDAPAGDPVDGLLALVEAGEDRELATAASLSRGAYRPGRTDGAGAQTGQLDSVSTQAPTRAGAQTGQLDSVSAQAPAGGGAVTATPRAGLVSTANPGFAEVLAGLQGGLSTAAAPAVAPLRADRVVRAYNPPTVTADGALAPATAAAEPARRGPRTADLVALGVPATLAARADDPDSYVAALQALAGLPEPPAAPNRPGDVLVVAGELAHALPVARQAAVDLHLDPTKILLAGPSTAGTGVHPSRRISGPAEAERRARRLHRAEVPHVVVVDVPVGTDDDGWAREVCDALGATAVWVVVDATRKTADTARHLGRMGAVDAIAVHGTQATADPAAPLHLAVPVAKVDGEPATPHAWAALLAARLEAGAEQAGQPAGRAGRRRGAGR